MEGKSPTTSVPNSEIDDRSNVVLGKSAIFRLMMYGILTDPEPDPLGFHTIAFSHPSLRLPYPGLEFTQIPVRYDTEAYLIYLGFSSDQAKIIFEKCKVEAKEPSEINGATLLKYANEQVVKHYRNSMWDTAFDGSLRSEVKWLESRDDPKMMVSYMDSLTGPEKKRNSTLRSTDYIKECICQRDANLRQFELIVHTNADW